ncbi:MAG: phosphatase PAP2 family protein, partial [Protaetiibacter sp.]
PRPRMPRRPFVLAGVVLLGLTVALGALVAAREQLGIDEAWMSEVLEWRGPAGEAVSMVFDFLGGGWFAILVVPIGIGVAFVLARRPWSALDFVLASAVSAGLCQLLKALFGRARPDEILLPLDNGSFPSGHTTNAAVIAVSLGLLLRRVWVWVAGMLYLVAMAFTRTYLGAHWLTDTLGGALLGAGVALLVWCLLLPKLRVEPRLPLR